MIEFDLPNDLTEDFVAKIPSQRLMVNKLMEEGKLFSYSLSANRSKLWCIVSAESEFEALEIIADFPLIDYMKPKVTELMFHNMLAMMTPISLN